MSWPNSEFFIVLLHMINFKQEAHGPHRSPEKTVQIKKHLREYHNWLGEGKTHYLFENWMVPNLNRLESPSPNVLCVKFGWNWHSDSWEEYFIILSTYFRYYLIIFPWEKAWPFSWTNLNPLHSRLLCAKFGWF